MTNTAHWSWLKFDSKRVNWVFFSVFVAPHLTGFFLKLFVWIVEAPMIGSVIISFLKKQNKMTQVCCCAFSVFLSLCYNWKSWKACMYCCVNYSYWGTLRYQKHPCSNLNFLLKVFFLYGVFFLVWKDCYIYTYWPSECAVKLAPETGVVVLDENGKPEDRVEVALKCLPKYDPATCLNGDSSPSFRYWKIRDYAYAYRSKIATPSMVISDHSDDL